MIPTPPEPAVRVDQGPCVPRLYLERQSTCACLQSRRRGKFFDELGDAELSTVSNAASQPNLGEGSGDEIPKRRKAPLEHISSAASHAHVPGPEHFERDRCGTDEISDLMREETEAFVVASGFGIEQRLVASSELRDGTRDRLVQTSVECGSRRR